MKDSTARFSDRVADYVRYRPSYPPQVLDRLASRLPGRPEVADVGAGTGILTELMLQRGWAVHAVEPNTPMRDACAQRLGDQPGLDLYEGTAEHTGLTDRSVDLVVAAQAFHWFEPTSALREFDRVLRPDGFVALLWNNRQTASTAFLRGYESLLQDFATDYRQVNHQRYEDGRLEFMLAEGYELFTCTNVQSFGFEALRGRLLSSSYTPAVGHPNHEPILKRLKKLFDRNAEKGKVEFRYTTQLYTGRPTREFIDS